MQVNNSNIVTSIAGRDKGRYFHVIGTSDRYALLADGRKHKLSKPKRKKLKHLCFVAESNSEAAVKLRSGDEVLDSELRRSLAEFSANLRR